MRISRPSSARLRPPSPDGEAFGADDRRKGERGVALLEAAIALGLVALIAATGLSAFSGAARIGAAAEARLEALALAESALERASAPDILAAALADGAATLSGEGWRVDAAPYPIAEDEGAPGPLALIRLRAVAGPEDAPLVVLETLRSLPR